MNQKNISALRNEKEIIKTYNEIDTSINDFLYQLGEK